MTLHILVLGGGGREHALVWKLQQSSLVSQIFVYPGNGGTESVPKVSNINLPDPSFQALVNWAVTNDVSIHNSHFSFSETSVKINLVVPGPEQPLVDGVESYFRKGALSYTSLLKSIFMFQQSGSLHLARALPQRVWKGPRLSQRRL
jgi:phosphoribosylamine--glycine ligase/phosphoribosylformylglycinamidine cyclo-ligase